MKLRSQGRGRRYSRLRGVVESLEEVVFGIGRRAGLLDWAAGGPVQVVEHELQLLPARSGRPPLRIGFVSDLHLGPLTPEARLDDAFARLAGLRLDVLALGGDYVSFDATPEKAARLEALVRQVPAVNKVAVLGNHDLWTRHALLEAALERTGTRVLVNGSVRLPPPWDDVAMVGLDDPWSGDPDPARAFEGVSLAVTVVHAPEGLPLVEGYPTPLVLCGHTHGGQVALPSGPLIVPGRHGRRWPSGLHRVGAQTLFVSRGLGCSDLPLRTFAPPDVALIVLR